MDFGVHRYKILAEKANVSERTIARYIKALRQMWYPIKSIFYGEKRGVCIDKSYIKGKVEILYYEYYDNDEYIGN